MLKMDLVLYVYRTYTIEMDARVDMVRAPLEAVSLADGGLFISLAVLG